MAFAKDILGIDLTLVHMDILKTLEKYKGKKIKLLWDRHGVMHIGNR